MDHYFLDSIGTMAVTRVSSCRVCASTRLLPILDVGEVAPSDFIQTGTPAVQKHPLSLVLCDPRYGCGLAQLAHVGCTPDDLYRQYWYKSGINQSMKRALKDVAVDSQRRIALQAGDVIVDIGANDGTLLSFFPQSLTRVGVEPARNLQAELQQYTSVNVPEYFSKKAYKKYVGEKQAKLITSLAMFYDLDDPIDFVNDLKKCLSPQGLWVNQMSYLGDMLIKNDYPNICHEHVTYYSLHTFLEVLTRTDMKLIDIEHTSVNGGSIRTVVTHVSSPLEPDEAASARISAFLKREAASGLRTIQTYRAFASKVRRSRRELQLILQKHHADGKSIYIYGASTKGNTLLQYCSFAFPFITGAFEKNAEKVGMKTVATNIPIYSESAILKMKPDILLVLPWHFRDEFILREKKYLASGGVMIFPLPTVESIGL